MTDKTPWTPDLDAIITAKWATGMSSAEISADLATSGFVRSRSSILSRLGRLDVPKRDVQVRYDNQTRARLQTLRAATKNRPPKPGRQYRPGMVFGAVNILDQAETEKAIQRANAHGKTIETRVADGCGVDSPNARPFMEAPYGACRWPLDEKPNLMACCNPVDQPGRSYCPGHAAVAGGQRITPTLLASAARVAARFDRVEPLNAAPRARPERSPWDAGRAAA